MYCQEALSIHQFPLIPENQTVDALWLSCLHRCKRCLFHRIPQISDSRIRISPSLHNIRKFLFCQSHVQCSHRDQRSCSSLVSKRKCRNLSFLSKTVLRVSFYNLFNRHMKHLRCRCFINLSVSSKYFVYPLFPRKPCDHTRLNCGKIGNYKLMSLRWDKCCSDQLGKGVRNISIQEPYSVIILCLNKFSCIV